MAQIIVTAGPADDTVLLRERINPTDFESQRFAANLLERLGWAVEDATELERARPRGSLERPRASAERPRTSAERPRTSVERQQASVEPSPASVERSPEAPPARRPQAAPRPQAAARS